MTHAGAVRPTPTMMPKRRAEIPARQLAPIRAFFKTADNVPRRGWSDATIWPDTGILLGVGTNDKLLGQFRDRYLGSSRVAKRVSDEIRHHSNKLDSDGLGAVKRESASRAVQKLLIDQPPFAVATLSEDDLLMVEQVIAQLRKVPGAKTEKGAHGGEAEIIALASRAAKDGKRQVMLSNDGGASVVAHAHGIPTRHIGHVIAELVCAGAEFEPNSYEVYRTASAVSKPPDMSCPKSITDFNCSLRQGKCEGCEQLDSKTA